MDILFTRLSLKSKKKNDFFGYVHNNFLPKILEMTEAFDLMSNSIFDNIITNEDDFGINLDDIWKSDLSNLDINSFPLFPTEEDFCKLNNIDIDAICDENKSREGQPYSKILHHDCMWSGTCVDPSHKQKKKCFRYCTLDGEIREASGRQKMNFIL